jgi:hypothetical protein
MQINKYINIYIYVFVWFTCAYLWTYVSIDNQNLGSFSKLPNRWPRPPHFRWVSPTRCPVAPVGIVFRIRIFPQVGIVYKQLWVSTILRSGMKPQVWIYCDMYVCMYVRTYVCMYVRTYVCLYVRTYVCMYTMIYAYKYLVMLYIYVYIETTNVWCCQS